MDIFYSLKDKISLWLQSGKFRKIVPKAHYALYAFFFLLLIHILFLNAPASFPAGEIVSIEKGTNLRKLSFQLQQEHIIKSRLVFEAFVIIYNAEFKIKYSDYFFETKLPVYEIARRISRGENHIAPIIVTIPEGFNVFDIAEVFALKLPNFNKDNFLTKAKEKEGYLFPDTYFFFTKSNEEDALNSLIYNYDKKIESFRGKIVNSGKTEQEIITMASIIEREAKGGNDREVISGILWKRIKIGMPLQVDAAPDTYKTKGLPESPIANPGLESINASIYPEVSPYLYYLHDKDGVIHYARNLSEHGNNIEKYLKN